MKHKQNQTAVQAVMRLVAQELVDGFPDTTAKRKIGVRDEVVYRWAKRLGHDKAAVDTWRKRMDARGWLGENGLPLNRVTFRATLL